MSKIKIETMYLIEKEGSWLTEDWSITNNANSAMKFKNDFTANLFLEGHKEKGNLKDFEVTEHILIED